MKKIYWIKDFSKWSITLVATRFDLEEVRRGKSNLDVLFGFGIGFVNTTDTLIQNKRKKFMFRLDIPTLNVRESDYRSVVYFLI